MTKKYVIKHPIDPNLITRADTASILCTSTSSLDRYVDRGWLHPYKLARVILFDRREVTDLAAELAAK